jgi:hypothetical protein
MQSPTLDSNAADSDEEVPQISQLPSSDTMINLSPTSTEPSGIDGDQTGDETRVVQQGEETLQSARNILLTPEFTRNTPRRYPDTVTASASFSYRK